MEVPEAAPDAGMFMDDARDDDSDGLSNEAAI